MKKLNSKKIKEREILSDDQTEIKRFIIILSSLVVVIIGIFIFTKYVINEGDIFLPPEESVPGTINYSVVTVGTMLGKAESEYYVAAYDASDDTSIQYASIMSEYVYTEDPLALYFLDLGDHLNKNYVATEDKPENTSAKTIEEIAFGEITLLKIKNGKIVSYYSGIEKIEEVLK